MYAAFFIALQLQLTSLKKEAINFNKEQNLIFINQDINITNSKIDKNKKQKLGEIKNNENIFNRKTEKLYSNSNILPLKVENINLLKREKIFNKEFRKMFNKRTNWSLKTQKQVFNLIKEAGVYNDDFFEKVDKIVKIALNRTNLQSNSKEYKNKYYLYFLQASTQIKFFNRNVKNNQERWQTGLQNFITDKNINKVREMVNNMDNFIEEINFKQNVDHNIIVILGSTLAHIRNRMEFAYKELIKEIEKWNSKKNNKQIIILTSDRIVFNNKEINKNIIKASNYNEIENITLTKEQKDFIEFYQNNNLSLKQFKKDFEKITENTAGEIVIKEINNKLKNYNNIDIKTLKTGNKKISNGIISAKYKRADTVDTIKTLLNKYPNLYEQNIVFVTNQPYIQSQKAQIETVLKNKKIEIVGEGITDINNDTIKIILQNVAGVINSNFEMNEKNNKEAIKILKAGIEYLKLLEYGYILKNIY